MDFNFTQDENDFRQEIKDWLSKNLSQRISNKVKKFQRLDKNDYEEFMKALSVKGWLAINWPKEHGGTGWSNTQKHIFNCFLLFFALRPCEFPIDPCGPMIEIPNLSLPAGLGPRMSTPKAWHGALGSRRTPPKNG